MKIVRRKQSCISYKGRQLIGQGALAAASGPVYRDNKPALLPDPLLELRGEAFG